MSYPIEIGIATPPAVSPENQPDPAKHPMPVKGKHPLRYGILGAQHTMPELVKIVEASGAHPGLTSFLLYELGKLDAGGAVVDLHVIDHPNGDTSGHWHIKRLTFGAGAKHPVDSQD